MMSLDDDDKVLEQLEAADDDEEMISDSESGSDWEDGSKHLSRANNSNSSHV